MRSVCRDGDLWHGEATNSRAKETSLVPDRLTVNLTGESALFRHLWLTLILVNRKVGKLFLRFEHVCDNLTVGVGARVGEVHGVVSVRKLNLKVHLIKVSLPHHVDIILVFVGWHWSLWL